MKAYSIVLIIAFVAALLWSCSDHKTSMYDEIELLEEEVFSSKKLDKEKGEKLIEAYALYANEYPDDTATAKILFKAGDIAMNMGMGIQAIAYYDKVLNQYEYFEKAPECLFMKAFIYENLLGNLTQAEIFYKQFLKRYPKHVLVKDAKASLMYLGKSPEELIKIFQEKNQ